VAKWRAPLGASSMAPSRRDIGFVFQAGALWPHMTVEQNVLYGLADLPRPEARLRMTEHS